MSPGPQSALSRLMFAQAAVRHGEWGFDHREHTGIDSAVGTGNNGVSIPPTANSIDDAFTAGDDVVISVSNSGVFTGANSTQGDAVAIINGGQLNRRAPLLQATILAVLSRIAALTARQASVLAILDS